MEKPVEMACRRCEQRLRDMAEVDAKCVQPKSRLKCACCRREYPRQYFSKNQRRPFIFAKRCVECANGGPQLYEEIMKEDEYVKIKADYDAKIDAQRRRVDPHYAERAKARAESRTRRNFRKQLDKQIEAKFEKERSKIREGLLEQQRQDRLEAEQLAKELEMEVKQMEERGEISASKPAKKRKRS